MTTSPTELPRRGRSPLVSWAGFGSSSGRLPSNKRGSGRKFMGQWRRRSLGASPPADRLRYQQTRPSIAVDHRRIILSVRPDTSTAKRADLMHKWHKSLLHEVIPKLIRKWESELGVKVNAYFLQRMKTKWGSCNHRAGHIRLNTELVKKPRDLLEYGSGSRNASPDRADT